MSKSVSSPRYARFRALLVQCRHDAGLTQAQLAQRLGKPQSFVAKYENGERRIDVVEFIEITEALKCDPSLILNDLLQTPRG